MAACRIVDAKVSEAVNTISKCSTDYFNEGDNFITAITNAISAMEGETKDALQKFIDGDVKKFLTEDIPGAVKSMSELLEANRTNFVDTDSKIAANIG
jgi:hypothetical protein